MPNHDLDGWEIVQDQRQEGPIQAGPREDQAQPIREETFMLRQGVDVQRQTQENARINTYNESKKKIEDIDHLLDKSVGKNAMTEEEIEEREKLQVLKDRQLSNAYLNEESRKHESKDIAKFKDMLFAVEKLIAKQHAKDAQGNFVPVTGEELVTIEEAYAAAINHAVEYISDRKKKAGTPKVMKVKDAMKRMMKEQALFTQLRMRINEGALSGEILQVEKPSELLFAARVYERNARFVRRSAEERANSRRAKRQGIRNCEMAMGEVKSLSKSFRPLFKYLTGEADFAAAYKGTKWGKTNDALNLNRFLAFISKIKPNVFYSGSFVIDDKVVQIGQNEDNRLTVTTQGQFFTLPGTTSDLVSKLSTKMIENTNVLGTAGVVAALSSLDLSDERTTQIADMRLAHDLSVRALEKFGGFEKPLFNNLPTTTIRTLAVHLMQGDMTKQEIRDFVKTEEEKRNAQGLAREHNVAMVYFLMKSEYEQKEILSHFGEKRKGAGGQETESWLEVAKKALEETGRPITNRMLFEEIMERVGHLDSATQFLLSSKEEQKIVIKGFNAPGSDGIKIYDSTVKEFEQTGVEKTNIAFYNAIMRKLDTDDNRWQIELHKKLMQLHYEHMQNEFADVPAQMMDIFLKIERNGSITREEIDHLKKICADGKFKEQMQTNMHDLELDILVKREEMEKKLRVTGIKSVENKQKMEEVKEKLEEKHKVLQESDSKASALLWIQGKSKEVEAKAREEKKDVVQKMIADIIFSKDTGVEGEGENAPGERMKRIFKANIPAITYLLIEYSREQKRLLKSGANENDPVSIPLLKETLERMPLGNEGGFGGEVKEAMEERVTGIIKMLATQKMDFDGGEKELSKVITGVKIPGLFGKPLEAEIPYVSVAYELEKGLTKQFEESGPALSMQFAEAEAKLNESINEATQAIQNIFNEQQGIKVDAFGNLTIEEIEDKEDVTRKSNKKAIEREKTFLKKYRATSLEFGEKRGMFFRQINDKNLNGLVQVLQNEMPNLAKYLLPVDESKPAEQELKRIEDNYNALQWYFSVGGDAIGYLLENINDETLTPEFYKGKREEFKVMTRAQALKGLNGASIDDADRLLESVPMKASITAWGIIKGVKDVLSAEPEKLDEAYWYLDNAMKNGRHKIGSFMSEYLYSCAVSKIQILCERAFIRDEEKHITGVADKAVLNEALKEAESFFGDLASLKQDYDICAQAKNGDAAMKAKGEAAENRFLDTFTEMNKQAMVGMFAQNIGGIAEGDNVQYRKPLIQPLFDDKANYGNELEAAYNTMLENTAEFKTLTEELFMEYSQNKRIQAIKDQDPVFLAKVEQLKKVEKRALSSKRDFAYYYYMIVDNRLKIREWLAAGGEAQNDLNRKPKTVEEGRKMLEKMVADVAAGNQGTGKFVKLVMGQYFTKMSIQDKRAMIASALREKRNQINVGGKLVFDPEEDINAAFISGYLKGAGPLLQKMLQGLPESTLPKEFRKALSDMKSNLAHIPDEVVQARLSAIVDESNKQISHIDVVRSFGAASVGETFLCKVFGPKMKEGKEVVVKILRPDVKNRMDREKAPGITLNKYMDETNMLHSKLLEKNLKRDIFGGLVYRVDPLTREERKLGGNELLSAEKERQLLVERIAALKKRKAHLITLSKKWTYEGIFGKGFYHADLHSGNIQVSDEKAVVLDFGNCTKLTEEQQKGIIRMMVSVIAGYADTFRDEFLKLMTETPKEIVDKNKAEFSRAIKHIFECGDNTDAALRIAAIISYASKLGFEIPRAVNDFADGALRLQTALTALMRQLEIYRKILWLSAKPSLLRMRVKQSWIWFPMF